MPKVHCGAYEFLPLRFVVTCQLCSTRYTVVRIKNCSKSTSEIKVATMMIFVMKGSQHALPPNQHLSLSAKMNGTQRRTLVSP